MSRKSCQMAEIRRGVETGTCREPATVKWEWKGSDPLYVCKHHDKEIQGDAWGERTEFREFICERCGDSFTSWESEGWPTFCSDCRGTSWEIDLIVASHGEDAVERYERLAAEFYRETGIMAPGKDRPPAMAGIGPDRKERLRCWDEWLNERAGTQQGARRDRCIEAAETGPGEAYGDVTYCAVGLVGDLEKRGLSTEDTWEVIRELDDRVRLYKINPHHVPPYGSEARDRKLHMVDRTTQGEDDES